MRVPEAGLPVLSEEQLATVHETAMRICEEIGLDVLHEEMRRLLQAAGLRVEGERVAFDRVFVMEQVAKAPARFTLRARDPAKTHEVGGPTPLWMNVGGPPFASDLEGGRRSGTLDDHDTLVKLTHAADVLNCVQTGAVEAMDLDVATRHLDMEYSTIRWSDGPYTTYGTNGPKARDGVEMGLAHDQNLVGIAQTAVRPVGVSVICLIDDKPMLGFLFMQPSVEPHVFGIGFARLGNPWHVKELLDPSAVQA